MSALDLVPGLALLAVLTRELLWLTGAAIFLSSLDDIAVDCIWLARLAFSGPEPLPDAPPRPGAFAILVPAWDEARVIGPMLKRLTATLEHSNYRLFVGTYPNDPATRAAAEAVGDARIEVIVTARPGPTTKADCLNRLWQAAVRHEAATATRFKAVVLHDAEDVVHPRSLDLYDRFMPALAMVQLPVLPLPDAASRWIAGHYLDEFAQNHAKDMRVRALLGAPVPSAGVGTAIDREALARLAGPANAPFDASSLTEDYELGHKLHRLGLKGRMVRVWADGELVATREYFPASLDGAVRQKSRWLVGIALSGWDRLGWHGSVAARWMLLRDRKGLFTAAVAMLAYGALLLMLGQLALRALLAQSLGHPLPPLLGPAKSLLPAFLLFNASLLLWRLAMRAGFTWRHYGAGEALRSVPRAVLANGINFLAALRAVDRYRATLETGRPARWDKTEHRFPTADEGARG